MPPPPLPDGAAAAAAFVPPLAGARSGAFPALGSGASGGAIGAAPAAASLSSAASRRRASGAARSSRAAAAAAPRCSVPATPAAAASAAASTPPPPPPSSSSSSMAPAPAAAAEAVVCRWYRPVPPDAVAVRAAVAAAGDGATVTREDCFNVLLEGGAAALPDAGRAVLEWLLAETYEPTALRMAPHLVAPGGAGGAVLEVGPRLNFQTAWSSNAVSICAACGVGGISRLERSRRYLLAGPGGAPVPADSAAAAAFAAAVHDRMTETVYGAPLTSMDSGLTPAATYTVPLLAEGRAALEAVNTEMGLGFDDWDLQYYYDLFVGKLGRDPTSVELFDMAQSNSEHSRHWFFMGRLVIDGSPIPEKHLLAMVKETLTVRGDKSNSVVAFADNSSTIRGGPLPVLLPATPGAPSRLAPVTRDRDLLFTAETHNFPSGVAPFAGAETGTGGRIRDTAATGVGSLVSVASAGYSVGNLRIPGYPLPWEDAAFRYPSRLASPLTIAVQASNGASDYGNKFGEPIVSGFARSYGLRLPGGERREYVKPIMFSGGMGSMDHSHAWKGTADVGLCVVKVGGPAYRIGMGGGAASSMVQGANRDDLDFNAVQRGDAEMAQKVVRVLRACVELGDGNPIVSLHDQGAGGNCNVVKELIYPGGATIDLRRIWVGDASLSALEIWGAEYQEQFGLLLRPESLPLFEALCAREKVVSVCLGTIDGSGRVTLYDSELGANVEDLDLEDVLGDLPQKTFVDTRGEPLPRAPVALPAGVCLADILDRVLRLMSVGSKRFLTTKVDRSVTGLVAQQQCVGPLQLPLADVAVVATSTLDLSGGATAIGERPSLTALSPAAMARMSVGEMLTNLGAAAISSLPDVKCEGNWMWAAKMEHEGAAIYDAAAALRDVMIRLEISIDGGKDSLSMAALCPGGGADGEGADAAAATTETVKAPGTLVMTAYVNVPDVRVAWTPDLKRPGGSDVLLVDIARGRRRLGGSALAHVYGQLGGAPPDVDDGGDTLRAAFDAIQAEHGAGRVLAYHDVSDGGVLTAVLEMAFAGNCGVDVVVDSAALAAADADAAGASAAAPWASSLFAEELGVLLEVASGADSAAVAAALEAAGVPVSVIATSRADKVVSVKDRGVELLPGGDVRALRDLWEETSFQLERQQAAPACVAEEQAGLAARVGPSYALTFTPAPTPAAVMAAPAKVRVAVIREEGSNGDREMAAALHLAGMDPWDVSTSDLAEGRVTLDGFRGAVFVGGFSYADVLDSAKGWAGVVRYRDAVRDQVEAFLGRPDTFSLGICNGCQLLALLGVVPFGPVDRAPSASQPRFVHNTSGRFESRWSAVRISDSPSVLLRGMGGSVLGVWSAHGEGRAYFPDPTVLDAVRAQRLAAVVYVDDAGEPTQAYPANPNGSADAIAALTSPDGRHLAMMPHPERAAQLWQWPYLPGGMREQLAASPWLRMFQNARTWCEESCA